MSKQRFYRASAASSAASVALSITWGATGASWALWADCAAIAVAIGMLLGSYIEPKEQ
jgi:hypothetical protein